MPDISVSILRLHWLSLAWFEVAYVVLPGGVLYWLLTRETRLMRLVAVGAPVGHALCVLLYLASKALGAPWLFLYSPAVFLAAGAAAWRRKRPVLSVDAGPADAAALAALFAVLGLLIYVDAYLLYQLPSEHPALYLDESDLGIFLALAAEIKHHWPPEMPFIAGEPLRYHYFAYARMAAMSTATAVPLDEILFRLAIVPTLALSALQVFVLGRMLGKTATAGLCAAGILLLVRDVFPASSSLLGGAALFGNIVASPSFLYGMVFFGAMLVHVAATLGREIEAAAFWKRAVVFALLIYGATGGKATVVPPLLAGLAWIALRQWRRGCPDAAKELLALAAIGGALFSAMALLLFREAQPLWFEPFHVIKGTVAALPLLASVARVVGPQAASLLLALLVLSGWFAVYLLGLALFRRDCSVRETPAATLLSVVAAVSLAAGLALGHHGGSQAYFVFSAMAAVAPMAGAALAAGLTRRDRSPLFVGLAVGCLLGLVSTVLQLHASANAFHARDLAVSTAKNPPFHPLIYEGLVWIRDHTPTDAVFVSNLTTKSCSWYSAIGERRQVLESVRFSPKWIAHDLKHPSTESKLDPGPYEDRWIRMQRVFYLNSREALEDVVQRYKATHVVFQRVANTPAPALSPGLELIYGNPVMAVYRIPPLDGSASAR